MPTVNLALQSYVSIFFLQVHTPGTQARRETLPIIFNNLCGILHQSEAVVASDLMIGKPGVQSLHPF